jgi:TonB family protein
LFFSNLAFAQVVPEKIDASVSKDYEQINKLAEEAFKNIPVAPDYVKEMTVDPKHDKVQEFYKNIEEGKLKYGKKYYLSKNNKNEKIYLDNTSYYRMFPKETLAFSKEGKLIGYSIFSNKGYPSTEYKFSIKNYQLEYIYINKNKNKDYKYTSTGKFITEADFGPYMLELRNRIKKNWHPPQKEKSIEVKIIFKVLRDGNLVSTTITKSSEDKEADEAALNAIKLSAPFNPLPAEFNENSVDIEFVFGYSIVK